MWWETVVNNEHSESLWGPPLWIPTLFLPLGMTLLFLQYIVYIGRKIERLRQGEIEEKVSPSELADIKIGDKAAPSDPILKPAGFCNVGVRRSFEPKGKV